jgi:hypothetical protein
MIEYMAVGMLVLMGCMLVTLVITLIHILHNLRKDQHNMLTLLSTLVDRKAASLSVGLENSRVAIATAPPPPSNGKMPITKSELQDAAIQRGEILSEEDGLFDIDTIYEDPRDGSDV